MNCARFIYWQPKTVCTKVVINEADTIIHRRIEPGDLVEILNIRPIPNSTKYEAVIRIDGYEFALEARFFEPTRDAA